MHFSTKKYYLAIVGFALLVLLFITCMRSFVAMITLIHSELTAVPIIGAVFFFLIVVVCAMSVGPVVALAQEEYLNMKTLRRLYRELSLCTRRANKVTIVESSGTAIDITARHKSVFLIDVADDHAKLHSFFVTKRSIQDELKPDRKIPRQVIQQLITTIRGYNTRTA